jgi:septal ring factor EnvC (AmiA/AmiB activator)
MRKRTGAALLATLVLALVGCASGMPDADRAFEAGDYSLAVALYAARSARGASRLDERTMFRSGLACALAPSPVGDPAVAAKRFEDLDRRFPAGRFHAQAELYLGLARQAEVLKEELAEAARTATEGSAKMGGLLAEIKTHELELERVRALLREVEQRLHRLEDELAAIKRIDLERAR